MRIEMFLDKQGKPRLRLRATNGKILMSSEAYASKRNAKDTAESICRDFLIQFEYFFKDLTEVNYPVAETNRVSEA